VAGRMSSELAKLLEQRKLFRSRISREMIQKETKAAEKDLQDARCPLFTDWQRTPSCAALVI